MTDHSHLTPDSGPTMDHDPKAPPSRNNDESSSATEQHSERIGPYKLLQRLGEGGMGEVWLAEQTEPVRRQVALKLIKPGMDSAQVLARFEAERQSLALMDHPNIARVLDAGTSARSRPYFVMELVKGVAITQYCDEARLTMRERLELFVPICHAVQHAHQKGIIHRDLKPSNVLVTLYDGRPVPKVIDFGVAKALHHRLTERTMFTEIGTVLGTPEYMAPEQAELNALDVDTRADIYSLGVMLYEMLTGTTPFDRERFRTAGFVEMLRIIKLEEPLAPSQRLSSVKTLADIAGRRRTEPRQLARVIRGELDWMVMKAMDKERSRRYETANGLAMDIQRYLRDDPVLARPASTSYRVHRFVRRHRVGVLAAAAFVSALIAGLAGTTWGLLESRQQRDIAQANARNEKQAKENAEAVLAFVENKIFVAARPKGREGGLGHDVSLRQAIEAALPSVDQAFTDQPWVAARLHMTIGRSFLELGIPKVALKQFQQARDIYTKQLGPDHPDTLNSMNKLAVTYRALGQHAEALKLSEESLALHKAKLGPDHADTLSSMNNLANSYSDLGRHTEALKLREETLALRVTKLGQNHPDTLSSMNNLANSYGALSRHAEAVKLREETLALRKTKLGTDHPDTLSSMNNLANSYGALGRHAEALKLRDETLALQTTKLGPDHPDTLSGMYNLANTYGDLGRHEEAMKLREETLALQQTKLGRDHPNTLSGMNNLANSYGALGRHAEALKLREEALILQKTKLGPEHPDTSISIYGIACTHSLMVGKTDDQVKQADVAMNWLKQAVAAGYKKVEHMKKDTDLEPLRNREDYKKLIADLEAKIAMEKKPATDKNP